MNARERNLLFVMAAIVVVGLALYSGRRWFWLPLQEYNETIRQMTEANEDVAEKLAQFDRDRKKLEVARLRSLPANLGEASLVYESYLKRILNSSALSFDEISHSAIQEVRMANAIPNVKKTGHQSMEFKVQAHGEVGQLIAFIKELQKTPYEHRIKSLNVDRVNTAAANKSSDLVIRMTIEALLVAKTTNRAGMELDFELDPLVALSKNRNYATIADRNIFVGAVPGKIVKAPPVKSTQTKVIPPPLIEYEVFVPAFVRLTQTVPSQQEAFLRNLVYNTREIRVRVKPGFQEFRIVEADTDYFFFKAKVLRIDARDMHFQVFDDVYTVHIGQSLGEAMREPLSLDRLDDLDLERDRDWGKKEIQERDKEEPSKKKGKMR
ncbi:MAG: hypothetical protein EXR98_08605 [Gemmataceae bacterium]|nr:hypothetical protein [Gemmataceae bacterium]